MRVLLISFLIFCIPSIIFSQTRDYKKYDKALKYLDQDKVGKAEELCLKLIEEIKPNPIKVVSNDSVKLNINELSDSMANKMQDDIDKKPMIKFSHYYFVNFYFDSFFKTVFQARLYPC